jgi:hypothetical protein
VVVAAQLGEPFFFGLRFARCRYISSLPPFLPSSPSTPTPLTSPPLPNRLFYSSNGKRKSHGRKTHHNTHAHSDENAAGQYDPTFRLGSTCSSPGTPLLYPRTQVGAGSPGRSGPGGGCWARSGFGRGGGFRGGLVSLRGGEEVQELGMGDGVEERGWL